MDLERIDPVEEFDLTSASESAPEAGDERNRVLWSWESATSTGLPVEPSPPETAPAPDPVQNLRALLAFHAQGRRPAPAGKAAPDIAVPALLYPYRDLSRVRHAYPVCLDGSDADRSVRSLSEIVDRILAEIAEPDEAGEQRRRNVYRIESIIRSMSGENDGERLTVMWDRAAARLFESVPAEKEAVLRESVAASRKALDGDGAVIGCGPDTPLRLALASLEACWRERSLPVQEDVDALVRGLQDILSADFSQSASARTPEHLRDSLGAGDDVDFQAMSSILASRPHESALSPARRSRIEALLTTLEHVRPALGTDGDPARTAFRYDAVLDDCAAALAEHERRMVLLTDFFKSVRMARLEIQNQYRDGVHDAYFSAFDRSQLTDDELALCPPVVVRVTDESLSKQSTDFMASLQTRAPIKVLLQIEHVLDVDRVAVGWPARVAAMAAALQHVFVVQAPVSRVAVLRTRLLDGMRYAGPAVFSIYAPAADAASRLSPYLLAEAAAESRVFPVFAFDPARGETHADRADVGDNTRAENDWPAEQIAYRSADGEDAAIEVAFTPADFIYADAPASRHFWSVPAELWHENMTPLHEYLVMTAEQAAGRIPYLTVVGDDGHLGRVVPTRAVVEFAFEARAFWRGLQEWGGVNNSHALRLLEAEKQRLEREKESEVEAVEKNYLAQLDQDVNELAKAIVQRIAGQMLGMEGAAPALRAAPAPGAPKAAAPAAPAAPAAAEPATEAPPPVEEEEEEEVSFDDAYIDTPLCTSCNECTQLNNRMFAYNGNKQAEVKDAGAGPYSDLVRAAELCPVHIIHPGKPKNPDEPGLEEWIKRAERFN